MVHQRNWIIVAVVVFTLIAFIPFAQAEPPAEPGNPGLPGCLATVDQLEQIIGALQEQVNTLQTQLDAMQNYAPVPQTGQTTPYYSGDDGDLQMGVPLPIPRFTDNANGTVTDNLTGLIWLKNANCFGEQTWAEALSACNTLASPACGLTDGSVAGDWRLPNVKELESLIHFSYYQPALPNTAGTGQWLEEDPFTGVLSNFYWSSTTYAPVTTFAWRMYMQIGRPNYGLKTEYINYHVWPVRGGN